MSGTPAGAKRDEKLALLLKYGNVFLHGKLKKESKIKKFFKKSIFRQFHLDEVFGRCYTKATLREQELY